MARLELLNPNLSACCLSAEPPSFSPRAPKAVLHDWVNAPMSGTWPLPVPQNLAVGVDQRVAGLRQLQDRGRVHRGVRVVATGAERGRARHDLEARARRVAGVDRPVEQRLARVVAVPRVDLVELVPVEGGVGVRVEGRVGGHRQDRAGLRVERDHGAGLAGRLERRVRRLLGLGVDGQLHARALLLLAGDQVDQVAHGELRVGSLQQLVVGELDAGRAVQRVVAGHRRVQRAVRVVPLVFVDALDRLRLGDRDPVGGANRAALVLVLLVERADVA